MYCSCGLIHSIVSFIFNTVHIAASYWILLVQLALESRQFIIFPNFGSDKFPFHSALFWYYFHTVSILLPTSTKLTHYFQLPSYGHPIFTLFHDRNMLASSMIWLVIWIVQQYILQKKSRNWLLATIWWWMYIEILYLKHPADNKIQLVSYS